ncbi:MAG: phosphotransferase [Deltaproteobacteria bacterium]|nr:phosphotransferase [Deltaproteobacteria bacterium]
MKAMILAAGFGTRLRPFTENIPKPLFTIFQKPLLDITIRNLQKAGCKAIIINTHHLHEKIESYILSQNYSIPVYIRYESSILGTGGAIKNVEDFWGSSPFIVINSDIVTDINFREVYSFHLKGDSLATLVVHDYYEFNKLSIDRNDFIIGFDDKKIDKDKKKDNLKMLAFTGIHVLNPEITNFIPAGKFSSIIDVYTKLEQHNKKIKAFIAKNLYWRDIGTLNSYRKTVIENMAATAFKKIGYDSFLKNITHTKLKGDGSDRKWYRFFAGSHSLIMSDHGINTSGTRTEACAFVKIGRHLYKKGIPVPEIYLYDTISGIVFLEDLGDRNLQLLVHQDGNPENIILWYKSIIDLLIKMSFKGAEGFNPLWTFQSADYNIELILEKECRYFVDAFLNGYSGLNYLYENFLDDFTNLAEKAVTSDVAGFMHRDFQSRNIMEKKGDFYFIDFQGGRKGPIQYDLASLLIDPYVNLSCAVQSELLDYCITKLSSFININREKFISCYRHCTITRNLQMLGAFGYLGRVKGKKFFERYIPAALKILRHNLQELGEDVFPVLNAAIKGV